MDELITNFSAININSPLIFPKGQKSSIEGAKYEHMVFDIVSKCMFNGKKFNTQTRSELGGSSSANDIECNHILNNDVAIEIKKFKTPDWMQCTLVYDKINNKWGASKQNVIPIDAQNIFIQLISNVNIFNGKIPPFVEKNITHDEWIKIKSNTMDFNDMYVDCPNDTIAQLYCNKGCVYIQISEKGLYHLDDDMCEFGVPKFTCAQQIRIRTKIHARKNAKGYCKLSVVAACKPKNISLLLSSPYSLDNPEKLPICLKYEV